MYYNVYLLAAIHNISAHNVLSTMTKMSTIYIHHIHNMDSIHLDIVLIQRFMILAEYWHIDLTKNWPKIWFTWKIWKRFWLTHLTQGQDWVRGEKNIFRNPSSTKWSLYTMLFSLSVSLAPKNAQTKFHAWKLEASVHNFDIPEWLQSTICTLCTLHKPSTKIKIHG